MPRLAAYVDYDCVGLCIDYFNEKAIWIFKIGITTTQYGMNVIGVFSDASVICVGADNHIHVLTLQLMLFGFLYVSIIHLTQQKVKLRLY